MADSPDEPIPVDPASRALGVRVDKDVHLQRSGLARKAIRASLGVFVVSLVTVFLCAYLGGSMTLASVAALALLGAPIAALVSWGLGALWLRAGTAMRADEAGIAVEKAKGSTTLLPPSEIAEGWFSPRENCVFLKVRSGDVYRVVVETQAEAQALLEHAGVDARKRTLRARLGDIDFPDALTWVLGPVGAFWAAQAVGSALAMGGSLPIPLGMVLFALLFFLQRQFFGPAHVVIGADGIIVKQNLRTRFVSYDDILSISTGPNHVTLHLASGGVVRARGRHLDARAQAMLRARVDAALTARADRSAEPGALAELDRGGRSAAEFRQAMKALLAQDRGYRASRLTRQHLAEVLENPGAPVDRRLGAAMALATGGDEEGKTRIRMAAEASANQRMRVALDKIAAGRLDDEAIDEAIAEDEARRPRPATRGTR